MKFDTFFKLTSYLVVVCGLLSLFVSGGVGVLFAIAFLGLVGLAWRFEDTKFQISDRLGTALVILALPMFYLVWKFRMFGAGGGEPALAALLSRFILGLSLVKLFQKKRDRDWLFLYLMAFFEVLLSAALSISPLYLAVLLLYLLFTSVAIIAFEIGKSARIVAGEDGSESINKRLDSTPFRRLPSTAVMLTVAVVAFATPIFFTLPRVGGAGFGANQGGLTGMTGFSDSVRLGEIGRIQQSDQTVMRVKVEGSERPAGGFRWRGIALDQFDNKSWRQLPSRRITFIRTDRETFLVGARYNRPKLVSQTFYVEPLDTSVVFAQPRAILVQGSFPELRKDEGDGLTATRGGIERTNYSVQSDIGVPPPDQLRADETPYSVAEAQRYLQLPPDLDPRIPALAAEIIGSRSNRYDQAKAVEEFLQTQFGYTLEQKASGDQPVADFLFNIREGHCEYFSSSMVLMLRSQGIAARVVNGFQQGDYNETADVYVVKQRDAHSWVEVYFPKDKVWVTFDPTPFAGQSGDYAAAGLLDSLGDYVEALQMFWIQYFVAYDNNEQKSLFRSMKDGFTDAQSSISNRADDLQTRLKHWWSELRGEQGTTARWSAIASGALYFGAAAGLAVLVVFAVRFARRRHLWQRFVTWIMRRQRPGIVAFYDRMLKILSRQGLRRESWQTPLEFAAATGIAEVSAVTEKYNRVRFGGEDLSVEESDEVANLLNMLERRKPQQ